MIGGFRGSITENGTSLFPIPIYLWLSIFIVIFIAIVGSWLKGLLRNQRNTTFILLLPPGQQSLLKPFILLQKLS